jgi:surface protein
MFSECKSLKSLNVSTFNTYKVYDMRGMFSDCSSLESLDVSSLITKNVEDMCAMFSRCTSLKSLDLSTFDTFNVKDMYRMFENCRSLKSLNISSFNTYNVLNMSKMFFACDSLKSLFLPNSFTMKKVMVYDDMFSDYCIEIIYNENSLKKDILNKINECKNIIKINIYSENIRNKFKFINLFPYENIKMYVNDIEYEYKDEVDILVGGSPCQAFSVNGKRGGFEDTRGTLFYEYARIIKETRPKVFIYENVRGMLNHDNGKTWQTIKNTFNQLDYKIYIKTSSSGNLKGVVFKSFLIPITNNLGLF